MLGVRRSNHYYIMFFSVQSISHDMKYLNLSRTRFVPTRRTKLEFHVLAYKSNSDRLTKTRGLNFFPILLFLAVLCLATAGPAAAQDGVFQYKEIYNQKPPFYKGSSPLTVISGKKFISQSEKITVFQNFGVGTAFKIKETNVKGEKQRDFFFIWPVKPF